MKTRITNGLLLLFLFISVIACKKTEPASAVIDTDQVKKDIQAKENEFADLYNGGEMKNIGYYADDATSFPQNNPPLVGRTAITDYLRANIDSLAKTHKISFHTNEVFVSNDGNQVVEIGYFKVVDPSDKVVNSGNYMSLFVKRDGKYYSLRDMSASDIPIEP
jgi:ketosteroid isomerase-like protein